MSKTRTGITAKQLERELGLTYKTDLRMCNLVRSALEQQREKLSGTVELDETYMGQSARYARGKRKRGRGTMKAPVFGAIERGGAVIARVVPDAKRNTVMPIVRESVAR